MIATPQTPDYITVKEYLDAETNSPIKHEYRDGYVSRLFSAQSSRIMDIAILLSGGYLTIGEY
jgi:Uma2 family endonuclease